MSTSDMSNTELFKENLNSNNLLSPQRNNNTDNQTYTKSKYMEKNSSILDENKKNDSQINNNMEFSSPIYPDKHSEYPYYFKYSNSTRGDDFHKTKKSYSLLNENQYNPNCLTIPGKDIFNKNNNNMDNQIPLTSINKEKYINDNEIDESNKYNNWYTKFKNSSFYNGRNEKINKNVLQKSEENEYNNFIPYNEINSSYNREEIMRKDIYTDNKNIALNNEINNLSFLLKKINNDSNSTYLIKNKYSELFNNNI